ncbi:hypothetical protein AB4K20DRAFT_1914707 [Rhizopus microsporus]
MKKSRNTRLDVYGYIFSHFPLCDSLRPLIKEKMIKLNQKDGSSTYCNRKMKELFDKGEEENKGRIMP